MPSSWGGWGNTPEWATTGRVPSLRSSTVLMARSNSVRFQVGSAWVANSRAMSAAPRMGLGRRPGLEVERDRLVVPAPQEDRGVMAEVVDGQTGLAASLAADAAAVAPLQGQVLPQQQARFVGRVVELGSGDVSVEAQEVETRVDGQRDVAPHLVGGGLAERHARRSLVGALQEEALAVDAGDPVARLDGAQADVAPAAVADRARLGAHLDLDVIEGLVAQGVGPPAAGFGDGHRPLDPVLAGGQ